MEAALAKMQEEIEGLRADVAELTRHVRDRLHEIREALVSSSGTRRLDVWTGHGAIYSPEGTGERRDEFLGVFGSEAEAHDAALAYLSAPDGHRRSAHFQRRLVAFTAAAASGNAGCSR